MTMNNLKKKLADRREEGGFSLIDVVVTVAIIVALSVGGFVAYTGLIDNAKAAAVAGAADQVYTAAVVAENDSSATTTAASVVTAYNGSTTDLKVSTSGTGATLKVQAWNLTVPATTYATATIKAERGAPTVTP